MSTSLSMLAEVPIFGLLDNEERAALLPLLENEHYEEGETIFHYGDHGDALYIVVKGKVELWIENTEGQRITLHEMGPGDVFGEISLLDGGPRTAAACALEATDVLTLDRERLLEFIDNHAHAAIDVLTVMGRRLRATDELLRSRVTKNINEEEEERLTFGQRLADRVASFGGSWTFIIIFGVILACWMALNTIALHDKGFDPYPYILLNLCLSCLAALQAPIIMMSQNRQAYKDRLQADSDYQVNLKAELEVAHLHRKVDRIYELMHASFAKIDKREKDWGKLT